MKTDDVDEKVYEINLRHTVPAQTQLELHYELKEPTKLLHGFLHFPPGAAALVYARLLIGRKSSSEQICPIDDQYVALDASDYEFQLGQKADRGDLLILQLLNHDTINEHTISCIISKTRLDEVYGGKQK